MAHFLGKAAVAGAAFCLMASAAEAKNARSGVEMFEAKEGFELSQIHSFLTAEVGLTGEIIENPEFNIAAYQLPSGLPVNVGADLCLNGTCFGMVMVTYFPKSEFALSISDLNAFNLDRPHGNVSLIEEDGFYIVQRVVTNFSGVTKGSLASEMEFFGGYVESFIEYGLATAQTQAVSFEADGLVEGETVARGAGAVGEATGVTRAILSSGRGLARTDNLRFDGTKIDNSQN